MSPDAFTLHIYFSCLKIFFYLKYHNIFSVSVIFKLNDICNPNMFSLLKFLKPWLRVPCWFFSQPGVEKLLSWPGVWITTLDFNSQLCAYDLLAMVTFYIFEFRWAIFHSDTKILRYNSLPPTIDMHFQTDNKV